MVSATATIFTDSQGSLQLLTAASCTNTIMMDILRQCWKAAQELHAVPGMCVSLELRWLPSHMDEALTSALLHWKTDAIAHVAREMRCSYHQVGDDPELVSKWKDGRILRSEDGPLASPGAWEWGVGRIPERVIDPRGNGGGGNEKRWKVVASGKRKGGGSSPR